MAQPRLVRDSASRSRMLISKASSPHNTPTSTAAMTRLRKGLDEFLERDQDRALFDLAPRPKDA